MRVGNKSADIAAARAQTIDLRDPAVRDETLLRLAADYPDNVIYGSGVLDPDGHRTGGLSVTQMRDLLARVPGHAGRGRPYIIDPLDFPTRRAQAVAELRAAGLFPSRARIAGRLGMGTTTLRLYDHPLRRAR